MEKVFLDTNTFIDIVENRGDTNLSALENNILYVSVLSLNIWMYVYKHIIPNDKINILFDTFNFAELTSEDAKKSSIGPTSDFEDNMRLHSAISNDCSIFLTRDKELLKLGYFGKMRIIDSL